MWALKRFTVLESEAAKREESGATVGMGSSAPRWAWLATSALLPVSVVRVMQQMRSNA